MSCGDLTGSMNIRLDFATCIDAYARNDRNLQQEFLSKAGQEGVQIANTRRAQCESTTYKEEKYLPVMQ